MKLPCAAVRDLLPLYAEKMTEPETRALIEAHLQECPACRKKLAELENASSPAIDTAAPLRSVKKEIRRRRWYAALTAALFVFVSILTYFYHADSLKPLPWQNGLAAVQGVRTIASEDEYTHAVRITRGDENLLEPGKEALVIKLDSLITGTQMQMSQEDDGTLTAILQGFARNASLGQTLSRQEGEMLIYPVPDRLIYGFEAPQQFLWGEPLNGGGAVLPRLALSAYLLIAAALAALSGVLWLLFRKRPWSWIPRQVCFAPVSYILAHLLLMGVRTASFFLLRDLVYISLNACALYALISLLWQVWLQRKNAS